MSNNAFIKLVPKSETQTVTTEDVKKLFNDYKQLTAKTGQQLNFEYDEAAFPYEIKEKPEGKGVWFYLKSNRDRYHLIMIGVGKEEMTSEDGSTSEQYFIQITLPKNSTYGDKAKATEFARFIAKKLKGELHLFNGRVMYFYPRK